jgi:hypothetical protein
MYVTLQRSRRSLNQERETICSEIREPLSVLRVLEEVTLQCAIDPEDVTTAYNPAN